MLLSGCDSRVRRSALHFPVSELIIVKKIVRKPVSMFYERFVVSV
jgi:hypothetical protein